MELDTEEEEVFEKFQYWAYNRRFCNPDESETEDLTWTVIYKLWMFGDRRNIPCLQNEAIDLLRKNIVENWEVPTYDLGYIYDNTGPTALLRKFIVDVIGKTFPKYNFDESKPPWPKDALRDLLKVVWAPAKPTLTKEGLRRLPLCTQYHIHEEGVSCKY